MYKKFVDFAKENRYLLLGMIFLSLHFIYLSMESYQMDYRAAFVAIKSMWAGLNPMSNNVMFGMQYNDSNWPFNFSRYDYPTASFFFYIPFALPKTYFVSKLLMGIFNIISAGLLILFLKKEFPVKDIDALMIFLSLPVFTNIERGQIYLLLTLLLVIAYHYRDKWWAGVLIAFTGVMRIYPIVTALYFLIRKKYKIAFITISSFCLMLMVGIIYFGPMNFVYFMRNLVMLSAQNPPMLPKEIISVMTSNLDYLKMDYFNSSYTISRVFYFQKYYINFLNIFFESGTVIATVALSIIAGFFFAIRKFDEKPEFFYVFLILPLLISNFSFSYAMAFYIPFAFFALSKKGDNLLFAFIFLLPLFLPTQVAIGRIYLAHLLACGAICFYYFGEDLISQIKKNILKKGED